MKKVLEMEELEQVEALSMSFNKLMGWAIVGAVVLCILT